jgi:uncharacterized membrane protein
MPDLPDANMSLEAPLPPTAPRTWHLPVFLGLVAIGWLVVCCRFSVQRWNHWDIGVDTAAYCQAAHEALSGRGWQYSCYVDRPETFSRSLFSAHFYLFMLPATLLYAAFPHPLLFNFLQHLALAVGGWCVGFLTWRLTRGDAVSAVAAALLFFLYPPHLAVQVFDDINFRHVALGLIPAAGLAHALGHRKTALLALLLLALGDENLGLVAGFCAFGLAWDVSDGRSPCAAPNSPSAPAAPAASGHFPFPVGRTGYALAGFAFLAYTVLVLQIGLPWFLREGVGIHFAPRYAHLWTGPQAWWDVLIRQESWFYCLAMAGPLLFLPLLPPLSPWLWGAIPTLAQNLLSLNWDDVQAIERHYTSPLAAVLFLAAIFAVARFPKRTARHLLFVLVLVNLALGCTLFPGLKILLHGLPARVLEISRHCQPLADLIPPEVPLSAPPNVCARFAHREKLWFFPWGWQEATWVVAPTYLAWSPPLTARELQDAHTRLQRDPSLTLVLENPDVRVYRRNAP